MTTIRLQRLHLSSKPCPRTLAISARIHSVFHHSLRVVPWRCRGDHYERDLYLNEIENDY